MLMSVVFDDSLDTDVAPKAVAALAADTVTLELGVTCETMRVQPAQLGFVFRKALAEQIHHLGLFAYRLQEEVA